MCSSVTGIGIRPFKDHPSCYYLKIGQAGIWDNLDLARDWAMYGGPGDVPAAYVDYDCDGHVLTYIRLQVEILLPHAYNYIARAIPKLVD